MGSWFRYFASQGHVTTLSDPRRPEAKAVAEATGSQLASNNPSAVEEADAVLISVPIEKTGEVVREVAPSMRRGTILAEVSSMKKPVMGALREASRLELKPLSIHPLFGPRAESMRGKTLVIVPVNDKGSERWEAERWFPEADVIVAGEREHDRAMSVVLSLTYFVNLALAWTLRHEDLALLKKLAGTTFTVQLALAESVVGEDPNLVSSLMEANPFTSDCLKRYVGSVEMLRDHIAKNPGSYDKLFSVLREYFNKDPDFSRADERRFRAYESLKPHLEARG